MTALRDGETYATQSRDMANVMADYYQWVTELEQAGHVNPIEQEAYLCVVWRDEEEHRCCFWEPKHHQRWVRCCSALSLDRQTLTPSWATSAPGPDGFTYEFYTTHKSTLVLWLARVCNKSLRSERPPPSQLEAKLIFVKEGDSTRPENWQPIILLNADYKILSNVLCARLSTLTPFLLHPLQTSGMPGR